MLISSQIYVTFSCEGFHRWKDAPDNRSYLRDPHRHLFGVKVKATVQEHDREIEFHDLMDFAKQASAFSDPLILSTSHTNPYLDWSCEHHAKCILEALVEKYKGQGRFFHVEVNEDGECGAVLTNPQPS